MCLPLEKKVLNIYVTYYNITYYIHVTYDNIYAFLYLCYDSCQLWLEYDSVCNHFFKCSSLISAVHSFPRYSSGKIKSWNILTEESQSHDCADEALVIADEDYIAASQNTVTCVKAAQFGIVAGYNHGLYEYSKYKCCSVSVYISVELNAALIQPWVISLEIYSYLL